MRSYLPLVASLSLVTALALAPRAADADVPPPVAPAGWQVAATDGGWQLTPPGLAAGEVFGVVVSRAEPAAGPISAFYDGLWAATVGKNPVSRTPDLDQTYGGWTLRRGAGVMPQGALQVIIQINAAQRAGERFAVVVLASRKDLFDRFSRSADQILGGLTNPASAAPQGNPQVAPQGDSQGNPQVAPQAAGGPVALTLDWPAGWAREDNGPIAIAHLDSRSYQGVYDQYFYARPAEPRRGSMAATYAVIWEREMRGGNLKLQDPGNSSPVTPQPLRGRLPSGLEIWWDGGEVNFKGWRDHAQLFVIAAGDVVFPILTVIPSSVAAGASTEHHARAMAFAFSARPTAAVRASGALFDARALVGTWEHTVFASLAGNYSIATGAYLGDASTGGIERLELRADGQYHRTFAGVINGRKGVAVDEAGTWTVADTLLTLTPRQARKGQHPARHRIYGLDPDSKGQLELRLGDPDGARIPVDSLETGSTAEIIRLGPAMTRFTQAS